MSRKHRPYGKGFKQEEWGREKGDMTRIHAHAARSAMKADLAEQVAEAEAETDA